MISLFQSTISTDPQLFVNNVWGKYYYASRGGVTVMVTRNVLIVTSQVMDKDQEVNFELPSHPAFYLQTVSPTGAEYHLIERNEPISLNVGKGFQLQGLCPLNGG